jgi:hypothetical protein
MKPTEIDKINNNTINSTSSDVGSAAYSSETVVASVGSVVRITVGRALLEEHPFVIPEMIPHNRLPYYLFSDLFVD